MSKRAVIVGLGAIVGLRIATRVSRAMRKQMHRKMREHCGRMAAEFRGRQPTATA